MPTVFVAGIYGVGKSTLCEAIAKQVGIPFFSAGDLISQVNGESYGSNKVVADKGKNQDILAERVASILQNTERILLAGHFCIVNKQGQVDELPDSVFDKLQISQVILLESDCQTIVNHLSGRDGKTYSAELVQELAIKERQAAQRIVERLGCPLHVHVMKYSEPDTTELILLL